MRRSIGIIALTIGALLAVTLLAFHLHQRSTEEVVSGFQDQQLLMARHVANQIASYLRDRSQRVRLLSTLASSKPLDLDRLSKNIDDYFQYVKTKSVKAITVYDEAGRVIYSVSSSVATRKDAPAELLAWARRPENQGKVYLSPVVVPSAPGENPPSYALLLFEPVRFENAPPDDPKGSPMLAGGISLLVDMNELLSGQLALVSPKQKAPQAWIVDEKGTLLFHPEHPEMVLRSIRRREAQCDQCHISMNYVEKILREKQGIVDYTVSNSSKKLAAFAPIEFEEARWIVVVNAPYDAVTAFVRRSFRDTLMLLAVTILALVTGSSLVYRDYRSRIRAEEEALQWREKRALEEKARESEERYRRLIELSPDAIFIQCEGKVVFINAAGASLLGATHPEQLLGRPILELVHPDFRGIVKERMEMLRQGRDLSALEEKYLRLDGSSIEVEVIATPFTYHDKPAAQVIVRDITERKRADSLLRKSEEHFRSLIENASDLIFVLNADRTIRYGSPSIERVLGYKPEDYIGKDALEFADPADIPGIANSISRSVKQPGEVSTVEHRIKGKDGTWLYFESRGRTLKDPEVGLTAVVNSHDITDRKLAEEAVRQSEERYRGLFETMHEGFGLHEIICDDSGKPIDYRFLEVNSAFEAMTGLRSSQIIGKTVRQILPELEPHWIDAYGKVALTGEPVQFESYSESLKKHFEVAAYRPKSGQFAATIVDITERKRAEEAILKRSRQLQILSRAAQEINLVLEVPVIMRSLVASAMELVDATSGGAGLMLDGKIVFTEYNKEGSVIPIDYSFMAGQGVPGWVLQGRKPYIANDAEHDPQVLPEIQKALGFRDLINVPIFSRRGELLGVFEIHNTRGGAGFDENDVDLLQGLAASAAGALENAQILIERSQAEMETARQKTLFQQLFENAPAAIALLDEHDRILQVNKGFETMFHFSSHEVLGRHINETVVSEEFFEEASLLSSRVLHGETVEIQSTRCSKDGALIPVQIYGVPIVINQRQTGIYGMYVDLSESKRLEEQFRQAQKMEAVGRLAGGVAHDFNNLLTAIMGYSELLLMRLDGPDPLRKNVEEIKKAGERAASLTRQLLAFSRRQVLQPQVMDLNIVVSGMEKLVRRLIGEDIDLRLALQSPLGNVKADPGQIEQVILNLVINSRDAMPHGGKLILETDSIILDEEYVWKYPGAKPGTYVMLMVSDTGSGMNTEVQSHLFEPFFTTKEKGKGTGLGLSTVYGIVKQSNGYISAYSEEGRGSTFKVYLPRVDDLAANAKTPVEPEKWVAGSETVLLVEDEQAIRGLMQAMLRMKGYTVLEAADGQEALGLFKGNEDRIDLVITDVVMPRMSGRELATRIAADRPKTKVLFVSGYSEEAVLYQGIFEPGTAFLQKPFTPDSLARKVREVLDN
ncbi:MAG: PAS domain S-box protein [Acidobacteriia bacterium]|nr:PAS domain S-box protein [Terriglobia bacterium]